MLSGDTNSLPQGSNPHWITEFGTDVVFAVNDRQTGHSLWKTDGTDSGTEHLVTLRNDHRRFDGPDANPNEPLAVVQNNIVFTAPDASNRSVLWSSDGTA